MGQIWFQNRSIEFEVVRLDHFCCPIALTIAVQNLCAVLLSHLFWPLHAITNHNLNVSHSTRFLLFLSNSHVGSRFYKRLCTGCYYKIQRMTKVIQKLGHHASNRCFVGERVKGTLSMNSLNLGETGLLDKKSRNLVEWDTFRLWLVIACNGQNRCDKSTAQRFWTAIVRAMGQQKRSKRTTSNSIDRFWNQTCPIFLKAQRRFYIQNLLHKKKPLHKTVFTQKKLLRRKTLTQRNLYAQTAQKSFYTPKLLHAKLYPEQLLQRNFSAQKPLRRSLYAQPFSHGRFYTQIPLYIQKTFTHRNLCTQHAFTQRGFASPSWSPNFRVPISRVYMYILSRLIASFLLRTLHLQGRCHRGEPHCLLETKCGPGRETERTLETRRLTMTHHGPPYISIWRVIFWGGIICFPFWAFFFDFWFAASLFFCFFPASLLL